MDAKGAVEVPATGDVAEAVQLYVPPSAKLQAVDAAIKGVFVTPIPPMNVVIVSKYKTIEEVPVERVHELLVGARNVLTKHGFMHGWGDQNVGTCIEGAIGIALGLGWGQQPAVTHHVEGLACNAALGFPSPREAIGWNDLQDRETVLARLDVGIAKTAPALPADPLADVSLPLATHDNRKDQGDDIRPSTPHVPRRGSCEAEAGTAGMGVAVLA